MSVVKKIVSEYQTMKAQYFIDLVLLIGGLDHLRKREEETKIAKRYLKYKKENGFKENTLASKLVDRDLKSIQEGCKKEIKKIEKLYYKFLRLNGAKKFYAWVYSLQSVEIHLTIEETQLVKEHIEQNYHERKPFPYNDIISIHFDGHYCIV